MISTRSKVGWTGGVTVTLSLWCWLAVLAGAAEPQTPPAATPAKTPAAAAPVTAAAAAPAPADAAGEEPAVPGTPAKPATTLTQAKNAMQGKAWAQALPLLDATLQAKAPDADEAQYLKALVLHYQGQHDQAIAAANVVLAQYKDSIWRQKAVFLVAQAMVQQKNYRGAEEIYEAEAKRLLGAARKHDVAGVLVKFADAMATKPDPHDVGALPPNYERAGNLYRKALAMEIGRELLDEVRFKLGRTGQLAGKPAEAIKDFQAYLQEFDPNWTGPIGSQERALNQKKKNPPPAGQRILAARYRLAESMLAAGQGPQARLELEDLQKALAAAPAPVAPAAVAPAAVAPAAVAPAAVAPAAVAPAAVAPAAVGSAPFSTAVDAGDVAWLIVQTYAMPAPSAEDLDKAVQATADFLAHFSRHPQAVPAAFEIGEAYRAHARFDQAIAAFEQFIAGKGFALPEGEAANRRLEKVNKTPAELQEELTRQAVFQIGQIRFEQRQYDKAVQQWQTYITRYPNGPQWADSQKGIVNAEFQIALDAVAAAGLNAGASSPPEVRAKKYEAARQLLGGFLIRHPLDERVPQALFIFGQMHYAAAQKLEQDHADKTEIQKAYRAAIDEWSKLVSRFPANEESSLAQYRIGLIHEEKLSELEPAIDAYRKLNWGSQAPAAAGRVTVMTQKALNLRTERLFRTNEPVKLKLSTRNIEKLTVKLYRLDLESYFRKTHGVASVEALDIALIQPDKTWEFKIEGYAKYKPIEQELTLPLAADAAGVSIVNVSEEDLEATTLAIRSDLDLILKSSRREALVFVQDRLKQQPVADAELLFSDGQKIVATGKTGKDGVLRAKIEGLKETESLRVMAKLGSHVAADAVTLSGLECSSGLAPKGYLYTDRPAYRPGQTVQLRGIIRRVQNGAYVVSPAEPYRVTVTDAQGRVIWEAERKLSAFGTLEATVELSEAAALGAYTITATSKPAGEQPPAAENPAATRASLTCSGQFLVQQFQLEKMRLKLQPDRTVYFRGEKVQLEMTAEYYWGQPVVGKSVRYSLPDGTTLAQPTDAQGKLKISFDTTPLAPGRLLKFAAEIEGENVKAQATVRLAVLGFSIGVRTSEPVILSGQPFDVTLKTTGADNKPLAAELNLTVLRRQMPKPDPVLSGLPWLQLPAQAAGEVTVLERKAATDPKTGEVQVPLSFEQGGEYVLRATGKDRFGQVVTGQSQVTISDAADQVKLRFFADSSTLKVGDKATVRLHSRLDGPLALVTFEGEEVLEYRLLNLKKDLNPLDILVAHEHFPNFTIGAAAIDGRELRTTSKSFTVKRELKVTLKSNQEVYQPGQEAKVTLTVTDQMDRPVKAELSLALVDEALLALFPDATPNIRDFFQADAQRQAMFRVGSSCGFAYAGITRPVPKAFVEESERLVRLAEETKKLAEANQDQQAAQPAPGPAPNGAAHFGNGIAAPADAKGQAGGNASSRAPAKRPALGKPAPAASAGGARSGGGGGFGGGRGPGKPQPSSDHPVADADDDLERTAPDGEAPEGAAPDRPRQEMPDTSFWAPAVVTDERGQATLPIRLPPSTTQWRLVSRGCSVETLVGEGTANLVTRKDFFVQLKCPAVLQEGDKIQVLARVHNVGTFAGEAKVELRLLGPKQQQLAVFSKQVPIQPASAAEVLFDAVEVPGLPRVEVQVSASTLPRAGDGPAAAPLADAVTRSLAVEPWGLEYAGHAGGTATGDAQVIVELPPDLEYKSRWLTVQVSPALQRRVIEMALGGTPLPRPLEASSGATLWPPARWAGMPGADLLAVASAVEYAKAVQTPAADYRRLFERAQALAAAVVSSQQADGGWGWTGTKGSDWGSSAISFWALALAKQQGVTVHVESFEKGKKYLQGMMAKLAANDNDSKAVVLQALSAGQAADFANVNRLYRERNELSAPALAYTALALANLNRPEIAKEVLAVLESKAKPHAADGRQLLRWDGSSVQPWLSDDLETTAIALLALARVTPESPKAAAAAQYLLNRYGCYGFHSAKAQGPAVAALATWFGKAKFAKTQYRLEVLVNDKPLQTIEAQGDQPSVLVAVPAELLVPGRNRVDFRLNGRGEYAYAATLRGFSATLKDFGAAPQYYLRRRMYQHADLEYRGRPLGAGSTSPVRNAEIGQRLKVELDMHTAGQAEDVNSYRILEEHLPAGTVLVEGSLAGDFTHFEATPTRIRMYFPAGKHIYSTRYQLVGYSTGVFRVLPAVVRDATKPSWMVVGPASDLTVLPPGQASTDPYVWNVSERVAMGKAYFDDGLYTEALQSLTEAHKLDKLYAERDVARMLLWIHTTEGFYDARQIVKMFEILRERHPDLVIPFDRILVVGRAYRDIGEFERAWFVFRATIDASYVNDSNVSAVLQDEGQFLASIDFQDELWREYPDTPEVVSSYFALSQLLYEKAPKAHEIAKAERRLALRRGTAAVSAGRVPNKVDMLRQTIRMLRSFLALYPDSPLAGDAAFSMANALLELKSYPAVVSLAQVAQERYPRSEFRSSFQYLAALGHFWQRDYERALASARVVADGDSKDRDFARYILAQVYHAQGKPGDAITWYHKVETLYPDAKEAIGYFEEKRISLEEVNIFKPAEPVQLKIKYRNIKDAAMQVYKVDLMKLYLREKNLSGMTKVQLSGIQPEIEQQLHLGDGRDYVDKEAVAKLPLKDEAAYLVICRGDDLFTSAVVLITPLKIEVQEETASGRLRANVLDTVQTQYVPEVHVKAIGSADAAFKSGQTDLRGIYVADGLRGTATVIARVGESRYAFYRGQSWLGAPKERPAQPEAAAPAAPADYLQNVKGANESIQRRNQEVFDNFRRQAPRGVEVQQAK